MSRGTIVVFIVTIILVLATVTTVLARIVTTEDHGRLVGPELETLPNREAAAARSASTSLRVRID